MQSNNLFLLYLLSTHWKLSFGEDLARMRTVQGFSKEG